MIYTTPAGKDIEIRVDKKTGHLSIGFTQGGEIPEMLSGLYTSDWEAEKAIVTYLDKKTVKKNVKSNN